MGMNMAYKWRVILTTYPSPGMIHQEEQSLPFPSPLLRSPALEDWSVRAINAGLRRISCSFKGPNKPRLYKNTPDQPNGKETNIMEDGGLVQMIFLCKGVIFRCFQGSTSEAPEVNPEE